MKREYLQVLEEWKEHSNRLETKLFDYRNRIKTLRQENDGLKEELETWRNDNGPSFQEEKIQILEKNSSMLEQKNRLMEKELEMTQEQLDSVTQERDTLIEENENLQKICEELQHLLNKSMESLQEKNDDCGKLEHKYSEMEKELFKTSSECDSQRKQLELAASNFAHLESMNQMLRKESQQKDEHIKKGAIAEAKLQNLMEANRNLTTALEKSYDDVSHHKKKLKKMAAMEESIEEWHQKHQQVLELVSKLKGESSEWQHKCELIQKDRDQDRTLLRQLESSLLTSERERTSLQVQLEHTKEQNFLLRQQLDKVRMRDTIDKTSLFDRLQTIHQTCSELDQVLTSVNSSKYANSM